MMKSIQRQHDYSKTDMSMVSLKIEADDPLQPNKVWDSENINKRDSRAARIN